MLRVQDSAVASSFLELIDNSVATSYVRKYAQSGPATIYVDSLVTDGSSDSRLRFFRNTNTTGAVNLTIAIGDGSTTVNAQIAGSLGDCYMARNSGNFGVRSIAFGTSAVGVLSIGNGTAPTSSPANSVQLYAKDVSASSELFVRDEAGNITQLSPHAAGSLEEAFPGTDDKSIPLPLIVHHRNEYLGREEWIHLSKLAQAVERLTGEQFVFHRPTEERDWNTDQQTASDAQQKNIIDWQSRKAEWEANHDEPFDDEEPRPYEPASMPTWVRSRLERTS